MRFAICNETWQGWSFERACADAAEAGFDGIEIAPATLAADPSHVTERDARRLGTVARDAGLEVVGLHWLLVVPEGLQLVTPDDAVRERTVAHLQHLARACAALGGRVMVLGSPKQRTPLPGQSRADALARAATSCRAVCEVAGPLGVTLALEPLAPSIDGLLRSAAEAVDLIHAVDHPACRLHLDVSAMCSESLPIPAIVAENAAHLAHVHANDENLGGPGSGDTDFVPILRALRAACYAGFVSVEVFDYGRGGPAIARESLGYLRAAWEEAGREEAGREEDGREEEGG